MRSPFDDDKGCCGHDLDPDDESVCLVRDCEGMEHRVPMWGTNGKCLCHDIPLRELERRYESN
jgi:hypothetical protein